MRSGVSWHDVCVLNVSVHGVGIQAAEPPARGTYVEIRRGPHVIVARVAWAKGHRAGLRSQDPISIRAIVNDLGSAALLSRLSDGHANRAPAFTAHGVSNGTTAAASWPARWSLPASGSLREPWR